MYLKVFSLLISIQFKSQNMITFLRFCLFLKKVVFCYNFMLYSKKMSFSTPLLYKDRTNFWNQNSSNLQKTSWQSFYIVIASTVWKCLHRDWKEMVLIEKAIEKRLGTTLRSRWNNLKSSLWAHYWFSFKVFPALFFYYLFLFFSFGVSKAWRTIHVENWQSVPSKMKLNSD